MGRVCYQVQAGLKSTHPHKMSVWCGRRRSVSRRSRSDGGRGGAVGGFMEKRGPDGPVVCHRVVLGAVVAMGFRSFASMHSALALEVSIAYPVGALFRRYI